MLTAFGQESLIQRASSLGADYYIMKPFDIPTLLERVRQIARSGLGRERLSAGAQAAADRKARGQTTLCARRSTAL